MWYQFRTAIELYSLYSSNRIIPLPVWKTNVQKMYLHYRVCICRMSYIAVCPKTGPYWASNECMSLNEWPRRYWRVKWWMNESQSKSYYTARWMNEGRYRHKQTLHNIVIHSTDRQTGRHKDERRRYSRECRIHNFIILELKLKNVTKKHRTHFWYVFDTSHILRHDGVRWVGTVESPLGR